MRNLVVWMALVGCTGVDGRELVLDGPPTLRTDRLGPVEGPKVLLSDGSEPEGLVLGADRADVVTVEGTAITAVGPGEARIEAKWNDKKVSWTVIVDPKISLRLVSPPATLNVGQRRPLHLEARMGEQAVDPGEVTWRSSHPDILGVSAAGELIGTSPGTAYVIAERSGAEAMAEIQVVPSESP